MAIHMVAYFNSIKNGVATVMVSYSSWNDLKMHANRNLITAFLKNKLNFRGFVISYWQGIDRITNPPLSNYTYSVRPGFLAEIDRIMLPETLTDLINELSHLVKNNVIPISRIDDVVKRILMVKLAMGLFENPLADLSLAHKLDCQKHQELSRGIFTTGLADRFGKHRVFNIPFSEQGIVGFAIGLPAMLSYPDSGYIVF